MEKTITAIKAQKRNPNRVNIELDGEYAFSLSRIVCAWLKVGDHLTEEKTASLTEVDANEEAFQKALKLISYRPRTEFEIRDKLVEYRFTSTQIEATVEKLQQFGLLHDADFAKKWVENRNISHPRSQRLIGYELKRKGVAGELIAAALQDSSDDSELAHLAADQYARRLSGLDWITFKKKLSAYLVRRGFNYGTIIPAVQKIWEQYQTAGNETEKMRNK
jgi:regulatory protein